LAIALVRAGGHVGFRPGLADQYETGWIKLWLSRQPRRRALLLGRRRRLFLSVIRLAARKRQIEPIPARTPRSSRSACIAWLDPVVRRAPIGLAAAPPVSARAGVRADA
jgi:hypothetical protein